MDRRLLVLAVGMFAVGTDNCRWYITEHRDVAKHFRQRCGTSGDGLRVVIRNSGPSHSRCRGRMVTQILANVGARNLCCRQRA
jgi:hypothetical protein